MRNSQRVLEELEDVKNVFGSFILTKKGNIVKRRLSNVITNENLDQAGVRIAKFMDEFKENVGEVVFEFKSHAIKIENFDHGILGIYVGSNVNQSSLDTATKSTIKSLNEFPRSEYTQKTITHTKITTRIVPKNEDRWTGFVNLKKRVAAL